MKIIDTSIRRPVTITMFWLAMILFGYISFQRLAINLLPDITYPTLTVRTEYTGNAPAEIENLITRRVEEAVGVVTNVVKVRSISRPGISDVIIEFNWGTSMDFASMDVREKLDILTLPDDSEQPVLLRFDPSQDPIMRLGLYGRESLLTSRRIAEDEIKQRLESLEGVAAVKVSGGLEEEIHVEIDEQKLATLNIPIQTVTSRLSQENINLTAGTLKDGDSEYLVRTLNEFQLIDDINEVIIGNRGGAPVPLKDIGMAFQSHKERTIVTRINGQESVEIAIFKEANANTVRVAEMVRSKLDGLRTELKAYSENLQMTIVSDQSTFIAQSISEVLNTAIIGGALAVMVLFFFLRNLRSTVIISLAIPISVITTFFMMYSFDVSLNIMSLGGLALGIGMLVDNSIVVLESIDRYEKEEKLGAKEAARRGASVVGKAVVASTLTTVCVFFPIIFVEGIAGQLFKDQALTVSFSLLASLVVAISLIPMLSSLSVGELVGKKSKEDDATSVRAASGLVKIILAPIVVFGKVLRLLLSPFMKVFEATFDLVTRIYEPLLYWTLRNRLIVVALFLACLTGSGWIVTTLGTELIPEMSQGEFFVNVKLPVGTPLEVTDRTLNEMQTMAGNNGEVVQTYNIAGSSSQVGGAAAEERENIGQIHVVLEDQIVGDLEAALMEKMRDDFRIVPGIDPPKFFRPSLFSFRTPIEVEIRGYNLQTLAYLADNIARQMEDVPGLTDIKASTEGGNPEIQILFDRDRVAAINSSISQIAGIIRNKVEGDIATEFSKRDRKIDIRVRTIEEHRTSIEDLERLTISPMGTIPIPLASVAELRLEQGPAEIRRIDQERVAIISANVVGRDLGSAALDIDYIVNNIAIPEDFDISVGGQNEEMGQSFDSMQFAGMLALFLVYLVMASQFESLLHPLVIMITVPFSLIGVVLILLLTGQSVNVVVLIGIIMLAGIVVNNAIVLVDYINYLRREEGYAKIDAIVRAGIVRLRPIFMTTATTVLGLLPMAIGLGEGAEMRTPMGLTVIGGLLSSLFVTLVFLPMIYATLDRGK
jgi:hydrophobic/amphiphilic exporter-1 (mainly G- bacteria), HAE1 family